LLDRALDALEKVASRGANKELPPHTSGKEQDISGL